MEVLASSASEPRRAIVQSRRVPAFDPSDVRADAPIAQALGESAAVIALVAAQALQPDVGDWAKLAIRRQERCVDVMDGVNWTTGYQNTLRFP